MSRVGSQSQFYYVFRRNWFICKAIFPATVTQSVVTGQMNACFLPGARGLATPGAPPPMPAGVAARGFLNFSRGRCWRLLFVACLPVARCAKAHTCRFPFYN